MRPVLAIDLLCAGRVLLKTHPDHRETVAKALIAGAKVADRHRARTGLMHPEFGSGTLADAARSSGMAPEPTVCDPEFAQSLVQVLNAVIEATSATHRISQ